MFKINKIWEWNNNETQETRIIPKKVRRKRDLSRYYTFLYKKFCKEFEQWMQRRENKGENVCFYLNV